jgi:hypothetical protein
MLHLFLMDTFMNSQLQKTQDSQKNVSSIELCRACYADYFGKKDFRIYSINDGARVKTLQNVNYLPLISQE